MKKAVPQQLDFHFAQFKNAKCVLYYRFNYFDRVIM